MSKYGNRKVTLDNIQFDSKAEAQYYIYIKNREERGEISNLSLQPSFILQERFKKPDGSILRAVTYKADFMFEENGQKIVVDVKGVETAVFRMKARLFKEKYQDYILQVVSFTNIHGWETTEEKRKRKRKKKVKK